MLIRELLPFLLMLCSYWQDAVIFISLARSPDIYLLRVRMRYFNAGSNLLQSTVRVNKVNKV